MKSICVFCGSSDGNDPLITKAAIALADALLERNNHLVYGGAKIGIMGAIAQRVIDGGGRVMVLFQHF